MSFDPHKDTARYVRISGIVTARGRDCLTPQELEQLIVTTNALLFELGMNAMISWDIVTDEGTSRISITGPGGEPARE